MAIDRKKHLLYAQGWSGELFVVDIGLIETAYEKAGDDAFEIVRSKLMNSEQTDFKDNFLQFRVDSRRS